MQQSLFTDSQLSDANQPALHKANVSRRFFKVLVNGSAMHPTHGKPYEFDTYQSAWDAVHMCYGCWELGKKVQIVEEVENGG